MALTTAQIVRSRINDPFRYDTEMVYGDGTASSFKLRQGAPFSTISASGTGVGPTASVPVTAGWSATACTFDATAGRAVFVTALPPGSAVQFDYLWSVFSEDEMSYFTAVGGGIPGATLEGVRHLLVNYAKRARWAAPDGSTHDDTMAFNALKSMESGLLDEVAGKGYGPAGDFVNVAEEQQNWS